VKKVETFRRNVSTINKGFHKLGHFGKGGGEGFVWIYSGEGKILVSETDGMNLG
jgi:hypothetical protein